MRLHHKQPVEVATDFEDCVVQVQNGVHCTDLAEDAPLEVSYFFEILQH